MVEPVPRSGGSCPATAPDDPVVDAIVISAAFGAIL